MEGSGWKLLLLLFENMYGLNVLLLLSSRWKCELYMEKKKGGKSSEFVLMEIIRTT